MMSPALSPAVAAGEPASTLSTSIPVFVATSIEALQVLERLGDDPDVAAGDRAVVHKARHASGVTEGMANPRLFAPR